MRFAIGETVRLLVAKMGESGRRVAAGAAATIVGIEDGSAPYLLDVVEIDHTGRRIAGHLVRAREHEIEAAPGAKPEPAAGDGPDCPFAHGPMTAGVARAHAGVAARLVGGHDTFTNLYFRRESDGSETPVRSLHASCKAWLCERCGALLVEGELAD